MPTTTGTAVQPVASPIQSGQSAVVSGTGQTRTGGTRETFTVEELAVVLSHYDIGVIDSIVDYPKGSRKAPKLLVVSEHSSLTRRPAE